MARGFLAGLITGTLVSGAVAGGFSVLAGNPRPEAVPEAVSVEVTPGSEFDLRREDAEAALTAVQEAPVAAETQRMVPPAPDDLAAIGGADTTPAQVPETGTATDLAAPPATAETAAEIVLRAENPVLPSPLAVTPDSPAPDITPAGIGVATETDAAGSGEPAAPAFPTEEPAPTLLPETAAAPPATTQAAAPVVDPVNDLVNDPVTEPVSAPPAAAVTDTVVPDEGAIAEVAPEAPPPPARTLATAGTIDNRAGNVTTNRLKSIGVEPQSAPAVAAAEPAETPQGALARNAAAFENPEGKPLMAIVLIDDGSGRFSPDALAGFPYPVSFALDVNQPGAAAAAARYRAAGFEVLAMIDLPEGASAMDAEVAMQDWLARLPQAVAVLEGTGSGLQSSREASAQLAPILLETGHGLVMRANGLNTAQRLIARAGVPSASLFRDIDAQDQNAAAVRRFLDQAAMKASQQEDGVIVLGRLREDTIGALLVWGLQDRASSVALAPVSAVLTAPAG